MYFNLIVIVLRVNVRRTFETRKLHLFRNDLLTGRFDRASKVRRTFPGHPGILSQLLQIDTD